MLMREALKWLAILCFLLPVSASERRSRINLTEMLQNPAVLQRMSLMWDYPPTALYLYGDGRLILQAYQVIPDDPDDPYLIENRGGLVPTCQTKIGVDDIRAVVGLMIDKHFFDLPEKSFVYSTAAYERRKLELHAIAVDNGREMANRTFGVGEFFGKTESLPPDFANIENALEKMRDSAFPPHHRPCGIAAAVSFGKQSSLKND